MRGEVMREHADSARAVAFLQESELYAPFRQAVGRDAFHLLLDTSRVMRVLAPPVCGYPLGRLLDAALPARFTAPGIALTLSSVLLIYVGLTAIVRATMGEWHQRVRSPPNLPLLQAVDAPPVAVFRVYLRGPVLRAHLGAALGLASTLLGAGVGPRTLATATWLVLLPTTTALVALAAGAWRATARSAGSRTSDSGRLTIAVLKGVLTGALAGFVLRLVSGDLGSGAGGATVPDWVGGHSGWLSALVAACLVPATLTYVAARRRLARAAWVTPVAAPRPALTSWRGSEVPRLSVVLTREVRASRLAPMVATTWQSVLVLAGAAVGVALSGAELSPDTRTWFLPLTNGYLFVTLLVSVGSTFSIVGPAVNAERLRHHWETSSVSAHSLAGRYVRSQLGPALALAVPVVVAQAALGFPSLRPLAIACGVVAGAVIAESLLPPATNADGSTSASPISPLVVLVVACPALAFGGGLLGTLLLVLYAVLVLGAALPCLSRRILRLPSA